MGLKCFQFDIPYCLDYKLLFLIFFQEIKRNLEAYEPTVAPPVVTTETTVPDPSSASYHYGSASVTFSIITTLMLNYQL